MHFSFFRKWYLIEPDIENYRSLLKKLGFGIMARSLKLQTETVEFGETHLGDLIVEVDSDLGKKVCLVNKSLKSSEKSCLTDFESQTILTSDERGTINKRFLAADVFFYEYETWGSGLEHTKTWTVRDDRLICVHRLGDLEVKRWYSPVVLNNK